MVYKGVRGWTSGQSLPVQKFVEYPPPPPPGHKPQKKEETHNLSELRWFLVKSILIPRLQKQSSYISLYYATVPTFIFQAWATCGIQSPQGEGTEIVEGGLTSLLKACKKTNKRWLPPYNSLISFRGKSWAPNRQMNGTFYLALIVLFVGWFTFLCSIGDHLQLEKR